MDASILNRGMITAGILLMLNNVMLGQDQTARNLIHLNQIGFYPAAPKKAVIARKGVGIFYLVAAKTKKRVYKGQLGPPRKSQYSDEVVHIADFSSFRQPGRYRLFVPGIGYSYPFQIEENIYFYLARAGLKGYYYQRASAALPEAYAGKWHRKAGHPDDSVLVHASAASPNRPKGTVISSPRGWYDAGDYNKYIVNSGISTATLLSLYEDFPTFAGQIETNIPEQDNAIPDLLDEVLWNLRWMLSMQDPADGGVYHKLTSADFSGMVMPSADRDRRYVVQKSTAAALNFAAVMAQAARVFSDFESRLPGLADSCLKASKRAWQWAARHPQKTYEQGELNKQFDPDIVTGAYGDRQLGDEFRWAAVELYVTSGKRKYLNSVQMIPDRKWTLPSWSEVEALGYYTLLRFGNQLGPAGRQLVPELKTMLIDFADQLVEGGEQTAYQMVMGYRPDHFVWGSNSVAGNQAIALLQAYRQTSDQRYFHAALSNIDYLLGRNATGYSFLTGYGDKPPMHPHHRPSAADGIRPPVPGLLVGGPNPGQQDGCSYPSDQPNTSYVDALCSYASNEITINWNAPFVYSTYAIEALL